MQDPQSLHKYAYVHGDPVQGVDPTGLFSRGSSMAGSTIGAQLNSLTGEAGQYVLDTAQAVIDGSAIEQALLATAFNNIALPAGLKAGLSLFAVSAVITAKAARAGGTQIVGFAQFGNRMVLPGTLLPRDSSRLIPGTAGQVIVGDAGPSRRILKANIAKAAGVVPSNARMGHFQAHHIIPRELAINPPPVLQ